MKPPPFAYRRPDTLDELLALLAEHGDDAALLAGGQSLMPMLAPRLTAPAVIVHINRLPGLDGADLTGATWTFGALVRHADALAAVRARRGDHLLARALPHVAHPAIRNRGTVGGSLALADPAAEWPACALCLDAEIELIGPDGRRTVAAADFFQGLYATARRAEEIVGGLRFAAPTSTTRYAFHEVARRHGDYAAVGLAARAETADGRIAACRVVVFGAGERPQRLADVEAAIAAGADGARATEALGDSLAITPDATYGVDDKRRLAAALVARATAEMGVPA